MNSFIELTKSGKRIFIRIDAIDYIKDAAFDKPGDKCQISVNGTKMAVEENYELILAIIQEVSKK